MVSKQLLQRWVLLGVSVMVAIALSACSLDGFKTNAARVSQLVFPVISGPSTFNYLISDSLYDRAVFGLIYGGLLETNGVTNELEPALAESLPEISADKKQLTFTLKQGLKWSDGQPLTVDDVLFTYQKLYLNEKIPTSTQDILRIGENRALPTVRKLDDRRIEFTTPEPSAPFLRNVGGLPILPAHILQASIDTLDQDGKPQFLSLWGTDTKPNQIVGSGLYRLETQIPNQRLIFRRNPYYWGKDTQGRAQPYIERIVLQIIESTDTQLLNFRSGQLDSLEVSPEAFPLLMQEKQRGKFTIYNGGPDNTTLLITFNLNKARNFKGQPLVAPVKLRWFSNLAFRQAIAHALNREAMKNNIFRGLGELQNSSIPVQSPFHLTPKQGLKVYDYNPEKARQLLQTAGFRYNAKKQLLDDQGNRVRFNMLVKAEDKPRVDMAVQAQQDLRRIGIQADLQVLSFNTIIQQLDQRAWECYVGGFGGGGIEPNAGANIWNSRGRLHQFNLGPQPGEPPISGWEASAWEQEIDRLLIAGVRELDDEKRKPIYARLQQIAQEQLPFIYLVNKLSFEAVRDRIQPIKFSALNGAFWNLNELQVID
jgi:peptide/nickel transport system substrate-binding protein